jgi:hypothetical protein
MITRLLPIALASLVLSTALAFPGLAIRASGRIDKSDPSGISEGARPSLTKGFEDEVFSCTIWQSQGGDDYDYADFTGTNHQLAQTLSDLRKWHRNSVWGCD